MVLQSFTRKTSLFEVDGWHGKDIPKVGLRLLGIHIPDFEQRGGEQTRRERNNRKKRKKRGKRDGGDRGGG